MTIDLAEFDRLKKRSSDLRSRYEQAVGSRAQLIQQIKEKFQCESIEEAEAKLTQLQAEKAEAEAAYHQLLTEFKGRWGDKLD